MSHNIVITMTSYPARIHNVARAIHNFLSTQTVKPNIFYLWLSIAEFPNKEYDLPVELLKICKYFNIQISWVKDNEYCHKRWYVYPKHFNDFVFSIDDDTAYEPDLIENVISSEIPEKTIFNIFKDQTYLGIYTGIRLIKYKNATDNSPSIYKTYLGQCVFPPKTFPLNAFSDKMIELRKKICPVCDESWFNPFLKYNNIKIASLDYNQNIIESINNINPTWKTSFSQLYNTFSKQDLQLYIVLRSFPDLFKKWQKIFPSYIPDNDLAKMSIAKLINLYNTTGIFNEKIFN